MTTRSSLLAAAAALATAIFTAAPALRAQDAGAPRRPELAHDADPRDWRSYFACGRRADSRHEAKACFHWASRLNPASAEALYGSWLAGEMKEDSLLEQALLRDPFVYHARVLQIGERKYGILTSPETKAWGGLAAGNYHGASVNFAKVLEEKPGDVDARWGYAIAQYHRRLYDSSVVQLRHLGEELRRRQEKSTTIYHALDFLSYMEAAAHLAAGRPDSARAALQRALAENLAHYRARAMLADLALAEGDTAAAAEEWRQARELAPGDAEIVYRYASFLLRLGRDAEAERELRAAIEAEPHWADPYGQLAVALDRQGEARKEDAIMAYTDYLERLPRALEQNREWVRARLAVLRGAAAGAP